MMLSRVNAFGQNLAYGECLQSRSAKRNRWHAWPGVTTARRWRIFQRGFLKVLGAVCGRGAMRRVAAANK